MNARTEFVAPPYMANMQRVDSYADIDEILRTLYEAGAEMVAASPPQRVAASYHDAYASFPLVLRSL